jgi:DNA mismatch repair protein MutS
MSIVTEYLSLTKKYKTDYGEKTILLMQVGSFFEVYALINPDGSYTGSNIVEFSKMNDLAIANKNTCVGAQPVAMAGFGIAYRDKYIQKTQEHDYTIVFHEQDPSDKTNRLLTEIISPGTFFPLENNDDSESLSNNIMCIWLHKSKATKMMPCQVTLGIANIDIYTGKTALFQFSATYDHSPATYDELERYISAYKPSECLIVANMPERLIDDIIGFVGLERAKIHKVGETPKPPGDTPPAPQATPPSGEKSDQYTIPELPEGGFGGLPPCVRNAEKQTYQLEILKRFFPQLSEINEMFPTHYIATQAFCFLLDFVYQHNPNLVKKLSEPVFENYTDRLILANHSLNQLNIIDDTRHTGKMRSVSSFLNNCVTMMGKRQFLYQLHYPSTNETALQASYDITEHLLTKTEYNWLFMRQQLSSITDLEKFTRKIVTRKLMPKNLVSLVADLTSVGALHEKMHLDTVLMNYLPKEAANIALSCQDMIADITHTFNLTECHNLSEINETTLIINKGISPTIDALVRDSMDGHDKLEAICKYFSDLLQASEKGTKKVPVKAPYVKAQYVKIHETAKSPPVLIGTSLRIKKLQEIIKKLSKNTVEISYLSKYSQANETFELDLLSLETDTNGGSKNDLVITSSQIETITKNNETNKIKLVREMESIFQKYVTDFAKFDQSMQQIIKYTTELDVLQCKCYIAHKYNYCKPIIQQAQQIQAQQAKQQAQAKQAKSFFNLKGLRHPLIEHIQTNELYVTNDLTLGGNPPDPPLGEKSPLGGSQYVAEHVNESSNGGCGGIPQGILLYGTNAVGKTSFIKSVGIALVMAQAGLYVPCSQFVYKPYQTIFTRILGNDNLFKGLSTFAVEMTELRTILNLANDRSLVLGDELCSGTESDSALSIFTAGLEILHERDCTFLFATHFHEITKYEEIKALHKLKMLHMAVHYDKSTNALVYDRKLREGSGESMYGLEVCKSLHLPDAFLQRAHTIRMKYHQETQNVLALSPTHFNAKKLVGNCEICQVNKASEVHHLQHQKSANKTNDYIASFHKNHVANLLNICEACHQKIHHSKQEHKIVKTSNGYQIKPV